MDDSRKTHGKGLQMTAGGFEHFVASSMIGESKRLYVHYDMHSCEDVSAQGDSQATG